MENRNYCIKWLFQRQKSLQNATFGPNALLEPRQTNYFIILFMDRKMKIKKNIGLGSFAMRRSGIAAFLLMALLGILVLAGCSATRKIAAADILSKTKLEFEALSLDSVNINKDLFPEKGLASGFLPNPQVVTMLQNFARGIIEKELGTASLDIALSATNESKDTLWIRSFNANITLDTIITLPVTLKDSSQLNPGKNSLSVKTQFPLDRRIFKLPDVRHFKIVGVIEVALDSDGATVPLDFNIERDISDEEMRNIMETVRTSIINGIVNDWVGAILPEGN